MQCVINNQVVLSRAPEGPLVAHIGPYANYQSVQGYARHSLHYQVRLAAGFSDWLQQQVVDLRHVSSDHLSRYLRDRARRTRPCTGDAAALQHLLNFLRREGVIAAEKITANQLTPVDCCTHAYAQYLRDARALARTTIINYVPFIRGFLTDRFGTGPVKLASLKAGDVVRFVQRQAPHLHLKRAKLLTTALRSFLRFARYRGEVALDLAAAVPTRGAKFGKTRLVPLDRSSCRVLAEYIRRRNRHWGQRSVSPHLFVSSSGNRLDGADIRRTFYALSRQVGLRSPSASHGPRLHDLRHRFATRTLVRWYRSNQDPERKLPLLSAYLGHAHVADTQWYLNSSPELMREAMHRLEHRWEDRP